MDDAPVPRELAHNFQNARLFRLERNFDGVLVHAVAQRNQRLQVRLDAFRQPVKRHRHFIHTLGKELQRVQVAARHLFAFVEDQNVIAKFFRLAEDLRRQDDGPSLLCFCT